MYEKVLILEKAGEVFGEKGFYLTTIEEIASKANLKKTVLYKYFKNKDELFLELLNIASASRRQEVFDTIGITEDLREKLSRFIISLLRFARHQRNYFRILSVKIAVENREIQQKLVEIEGEFKTVVYQILQDGIRQGRFRAVNPLVATAFLGKLVEGTIEVIETEPCFSADQMILSMLDMVWNGLAKKTDGNTGVNPV
jgi:AcrR family transcriptional regulator